MKLDGGKVDIEDRELFSSKDIEVMDKIFKTSAQCLVDNIIKDDLDAFFPQEWAPHGDGFSGEPVDDPLVIYIILNEGGKILKKISLTEELKKAYEHVREMGLLLMA